MSTSNIKQHPSNDELVQPWYKQFWLWFLIFFPALAVIAGVITIYIAIVNEDSLVRDDYYKAGLAINSRLELDSNAKTKNISATLTIDPVIGEIFVTMSKNNQELPEKLELAFVHPTHQAEDFTLQLKRSQNTQSSRYIGQLPQAIFHRWHLQLNDADPISWRLKTTFDFGKANNDSASSTPSLITFTP